MAHHLFSQLAHVELLTPKLEESADFFHRYLGMEESARSENSIYMRAWGEFHHHSLKLTASAQPGLGHMAFRTDGPDELEAIERIAREHDVLIGYTDGDVGHGRSLLFNTPDGHVVEAFWDVDTWVAPPAQQTIHRTRPQKYPTQGAPVRRIDHVTVNCADPARNSEFFQALGFRLNETQTIDDTGEQLFAFLSVTNLAHDLGLGRDPVPGAQGRLNHVCFALETREELLRLADIAADYDLPLDWGPGRHRGTELMYMYIREPGGNRVEICAGGYLIFAPDWASVDWMASESPAVMWSGDVPEAMYYATPDVSAALPT